MSRSIERVSGVSNHLMTSTLADPKNNDPALIVPVQQVIQDVITPVDTESLAASDMLNAGKSKTQSHILSPMDIYQAHLTQRENKGEHALLLHRAMQNLSTENTELTKEHYNLEVDSSKQKKEQKVLSTVTWVATATAIVGAIIGFFMSRGQLPAALSTSGAQVGLGVVSSAAGIGGGAAEIFHAKSKYEHGETTGQMTKISYIREQNLTHAHWHQLSLSQIAEEMNRHFEQLKRIVDNDQKTVKQFFR